MPRIGDRLTCPLCEHSWNTRVRDPVLCPHCRRALKPNTGKRSAVNYTDCERCGKRIAVLKSGKMVRHTAGPNQGDCVAQEEKIV